MEPTNRCSACDGSGLLVNGYGYEYECQCCWSPALARQLGRALRMREWDGTISEGHLVDASTATDVCVVDFGDSVQTMSLRYLAQIVM